jgi:hypothetical protein
VITRTTASATIPSPTAHSTRPWEGEVSRARQSVAPSCLESGVAWDISRSPEGPASKPWRKIGGSLLELRVALPAASRRLSSRRILPFIRADRPHGPAAGAAQSRTRKRTT